jgi:5'-nucleotidase
VPGIDLSQARVLLTNDDGIEAPGLALLEKLVAPLVGELWVVAPRYEQSATSHALTIHSPLRVLDLGPRRKAVSGTPTDATLLALRHIMPEPPDLVLSGINRGGNIGGDVLYSGTVGAAMEAALLGVPAIAFSQNKVPHHDARWQTSEAHLVPVLRQVLSTEWPTNVIVNVNFPDVEPAEVAGVKVVPQGRRKPGGLLVLGTDPRGDDFIWVSSEKEQAYSTPGSDEDFIERGWITVTPLSCDLTSRADMPALQALWI